MLEVDPANALWLGAHRDLRHMARVRAFVDFITECIAGKRDLLEGHVGRSPSRADRS